MNKSEPRCVLATPQMRAVSQSGSQSEDDKTQNCTQAISDMCNEQEINLCCKPRKFNVILRNERKKSAGCSWKSFPESSKKKAQGVNLY